MDNNSPISDFINQPQNNEDLLKKMTPFILGADPNSSAVAAVLPAFGGNNTAAIQAIVAHGGDATSTSKSFMDVAKNKLLSDSNVPVDAGEPSQVLNPGKPVPLPNVVYDKQANISRYADGPNVGMPFGLGDQTKGNQITPDQNNTTFQNNGLAEHSGAWATDGTGDIVYPTANNLRLTKDPKNPNHYLDKNGAGYDMNVPSPFSPTDQQAWLQAHPNDPANNLAQIKQNMIPDNSFQNIAARALSGPILTNQTSLDKGVDQGLNNIRNTFLPNSNNLIDRLVNDSQNGNNPFYQVGKFGGETAPAVGAGLLTGGAADALLGPELGAYLGGTNLLRNGITAENIIPHIIGQGIQGAQAGALTSGGNDNGLIKNAGQGALLGTALGSMVPAISGLKSIAKGTIADTINPQTAPDLSLALKAMNNPEYGGYNIPLRTTQLTNPERDLQILNDPSAIKNNEVQHNAWDQAVTGTHDDPSTFYEDPMGAAKNALWNNLSNIAKKSGIYYDFTKNGIGDVMEAAKHDPIMTPFALEKIQGAADDITDAFDKATKDTNPTSKFSQALLSAHGQVYSDLTKPDGPLDTLANDPHTVVRQYARGLIDTLDDGLKGRVDTLAQKNSPGSWPTPVSLDNYGIPFKGSKPSATNSNDVLNNVVPINKFQNSTSESPGVNLVNNKPLIQPANDVPATNDKVYTDNAFGKIGNTDPSQVSIRQKLNDLQDIKSQFMTDTPNKSSLTNPVNMISSKFLSNPNFNDNIVRDLGANNISQLLHTNESIPGVDALQPKIAKPLNGIPLNAGNGVNPFLTPIAAVAAANSQKKKR